MRQKGTSQSTHKKNMIFIRMPSTASQHKDQHYQSPQQKLTADSCPPSLHFVHLPHPKSSFTPFMYVQSSASPSTPSPPPPTPSSQKESTGAQCLTWQWAGTIFKHHTSITKTISSSSAFPAITLGFTIFWWDFCACDHLKINKQTCSLFTTITL